MCLFMQQTGLLRTRGKKEKLAVIATVKIKNWVWWPLAQISYNTRLLYFINGQILPKGQKAVFLYWTDSQLNLTQLNLHLFSSRGKNPTNGTIPVQFISDILQLLPLRLPQFVVFCCQIPKSHVLKLLLLFFKAGHGTLLLTLRKSQAIYI